MRDGGAVTEPAAVQPESRTKATTNPPAVEALLIRTAAPLELRMELRRSIERCGSISGGFDTLQPNSRSGRARPATVILLSAVLLVSGCASGDAATQAVHPSPLATFAGATLALTGGTLVDGTGGPAIADAVVLVAGNRILAVGSADQIRVPDGVRTIDLAGSTILPGFVNAHVHRGFSDANLRAWAAGGVTTVRDESTSPGQVAGLRELLAGANGDPRLARLVSAGSMLAVPGGYGDLTVGSTEAALEAVDREIDQGAGAVKVALEDGYDGQHDLPKPSAEFLRAVVERAHSRGVPVSGHVTQAAYVPALLEAGIDDIAHVPYDPIPDAVLREMAEKNVYLVPTFTVFRNYGADVDGCMENVRRFHELGGKIALGNDYGGGPGEFEQGIPMYEVEMLSRAGLTPAEVVEASTRNGARVLRLDDEIGTIEPGKAADIVVVGGDALADLQALRNVRVVIHAGAVIRPDA